MILTWKSFALGSEVRSGLCSVIPNIGHLTQDID